MSSHPCDLCAADRFTHWYSDDDVCWVADCEVCSVPMVVWRAHAVEPPASELAHMLDCLDQAATTRFGEGGFTIDREMRQIPDHFHAHARDPEWWSLRASRAMSRYSGVGGERIER